MSDADAQFAMLFFAEHDVRIAEYLAKYLLKHGLSADNERRGWFKGPHLQQVAFTTALAVVYARPFGRNKGRLRLPEDEFLRDLSETQRALHRRMRDLRDKAFAHADSEFYDVSRGDPADARWWGIPVFKSPSEADFGLARDEITSVLAIIKTFRREVDSRLRQLDDRAASKS